MSQRSPLIPAASSPAAVSQSPPLTLGSLSPAASSPGQASIVQQFMHFMERPTPLPGSMPATSLARSLLILGQIFEIANTAVERGQPAPTFAELASQQFEGNLQSVMSSVVVMDGERYQFTPIVKTLLTTPKTALPSAVFQERLFRKVALRC